MKRRTIIAVAVVVVVVAAGIAVANAAYPYHRAWRHHSPIDFLAAKLDLSDAQKAQIKTIWQEESPNIAPLVREFANEQKQMTAATADGNFDESKVQPIADQEAATLGKLLMEKEKLVSKVYATVLTPEQRTKADQWRNKMPSHLENLADRLEHPRSEK